MRRPEKPALWISFLLGLALACCTGTSTDTENTLTAVAYLADGRPAAGAELAVRVPKLIVSPQGIPSWQTLTSLTADRHGRFSEVRLPQGEEIYLEVRQNPGDTVQGHSPQVYFIRYQVAEARPEFLGAVTLSPSGSIQGRIESKTDSLAAHHWIGVIGSSAMVKLSASADSVSFPFRLVGLYPGSHALTVVNLADTGVGVMTANTKPTGEVKPDSVTDLGSIFYNGASWAPDGKN